jgi:hypothetical protein
MSTASVASEHGKYGHNVEKDISTLHVEDTQPGYQPFVHDAELEKRWVGRYRMPLEA